MKKFKKYIPLIIILILITIFYLSVPVFIYPDSIVYYETANIILGLIPFSKWNIVRGPTMALIQYPFYKIFGNNEFSLRICICFFFLIMILTIYNFINKEINKNIEKQAQKKYKMIIYTIFILLIIINPIIYGYYHSLLTEFAATTISIVNLLMVIKFKNIKKISNKKYILILVYTCFIFSFAWFLKQPYFTISFFPILTLLFLNAKNKTNRLKTILLFIIPIITLLVSINSWKNFISNKGVDYENGNNNSYYINKAIIDGNTNYEKQMSDEFYNIEYIKNNTILSDKEKETIIKKLENNNKNYIIYYVHDLNNKVIDAEIFYYDKNQFSVTEAIKFTLIAFIKNPIIVTDSYISNYLASINVYVSDRGNDYYRPVKSITNFNGENSSIGLAYLGETQNNFKWFDSENLKNLNSEYKSEKYTILEKIYSYPYLILFKLMYLILPFFWLYLLIKILKKQRQYETTFIFITFVFMHTLFHVATGAIIDRYIYVTYPAYICGIMTYILTIKGSKFMKRNIKNKKGKILFVIPAYNEAENIGKVLKEIRKDVDYADILVINDCSKDNTKEIVESNNVKCISNIFNMKYAMAVQTGIKYAYENDYDYVIQFDADGQHIAKEAEKLYKTMLDNECDIVIGSRYLKDMGYPCPKFRRFGTKLFELLIKLFCNEKIADPLSGFQCLNKKVIKRYAEMGKYPEFPDANLVIEMLREGYKIKEVPVKMRLREAGESMHGGFIKPIKYMIDMFYTIVFIVISTPRKKSDNNE